MRSISCLVLPISDHVFFEQTVFEGQVSDDPLQGAGLAAQVLYLVRGCCAGRIAGEPLLPGLKEVFRPAVIQILDDPFTTAQLGDALFAAQALQHNADLLFCRELPACRPPDVFHDLFRRFLHPPGFLSSIMRNRLPGDAGAAARHPKYARQRRGMDRFCLGHHGPEMSLIAPVFSFDLNGYTGSGLALQDKAEKSLMQITIGIDISKETLDAYRLPDNQHIQVANGRAGHRTLVRWIGKQNGSLAVFEATGAYHRNLEAALA